ncbi:MAG: aminotransferase class I/II-fold pyridoxal phosphate-dependent enzyme [Nitrospiraceae bacterium]|jgi:aminotransferase|uniref:pyridoxal phosphate-dependent aminotransferase n=1 Tax=Nitrospira cf. moscoviensis SBR1015 TaxID=96242 RepID=UPI000A09E0A2|nr:aminotransferase class I/II-fold pyridoxal phosphate-dependent enzyme [Nitrospira cf. moscoviensis SBR1015]MBY0247844.1 aminotransferase class I/II-fold pyridoxal phosphate-dependent enzyme [Nitrospiraceae bacterium]OQW37194.1 MAG: aminotransferase [Nitrospira sp. SG-bin2]
MKHNPSDRTARLAQSDIRAMTLACAKVNGINMSQGVCDTPVPPVVIQAAKAAMDRGHNIYSRFDGISELRQAIASKLASYNRITADPETNITVSAGATGSFQATCMALLNPGDEVILFEPFYAYHVQAILAVEAVPRYVSMHAPEWSFDMQDLERAITPKAKALVVNSPGNPSGKVFTRTELEQIAEMACRHDLMVITDEIYEYFVFDGREHISLATLPNMSARTVTIGGYSKTFSITGWRIGYSVAEATWAKAIGAMSDVLYVCAPTPLQYGVAAGIRELPQSFYAGLATEHQQKRDRFCHALEKAGLPPSVPQGAYYVLADVTRLPGKTGRDRAMYLLDKTGVAGVPGEAFFEGPEGRRFMRFCMAKTDDDLEQASLRIEQLG